MHVTPVKLLVRAVLWFTWRVGVRVGVSFLLFLLFIVLSLARVRYCGCFYVAPFCGCVAAPWFSGLEELDVR